MRIDKKPIDLKNGANVQILEYIDEPVLILNDKGIIEFCNEKPHYTLLGYSKQDLIGKPITEFITIDEQTDALNDFSTMFQKAEFNRLKKFKAKNGRSFWFDVRSNTFVDQSGNLKALVIYKDITEHVSNQMKLKEAEERYRDAFNKSNFYKDILAHDMNNVLQSIVSATELTSLELTTSPNLDKTKEWCDLVKDQTLRGSKLISNIRKISEIEVEGIKLHSTEAIGLLNESISVIENNRSRNPIIISKHIPFEEKHVKANELLLDVFENILENAIRHNNKPTIEITIAASTLVKNGANYLKIEFADNGVGIPDDRKKIIFERSNKKDKSTSGMGLGLSLVKNIIDQYSGEISVRNRVEHDHTQGSVFVLSLQESS